VGKNVGHPLVELGEFVGFWDFESTVVRQHTQPRHIRSNRYIPNSQLIPYIERQLAERW